MNHIQKLRNNATTLRHEDWVHWDKVALGVSQSRLTIVKDLIAAGLVRTDFTLGDSLALYEKISEFTTGVVSMDGASSEKDALLFTTAGTPLPIFRKDFDLTDRQILASQERGGYLPTEGIKASTRIINEMQDSMIWNGLPAIASGGYGVTGLTTAANRNTKAINNAWGSGTETPLADVTDMIKKARDDFFYGPYVLYVSSDNWMYIHNDFSTVKGEKTLKDRLELLPGMGVGSVREGTGLGDGTLVLVQMTDDVIQLNVAQSIITVPGIKTALFQNRFTTWSCMSITCKSDTTGKSGIVHATGA